MKRPTKAAALFCMAFSLGVLCTVFLPSQWMVGLSALALLLTGVMVIRD